MKIKIEPEIDRINRYEKKWKIKMGEEKFKIIPIAQLKAKKIKVNGEDLNTSKGGKLLGLRLQSTGLIGHTANVKG